MISSTHKIVGSLTQSAMLHLGHGAAERIGEDTVDRAVTLTESTSPNSLLFASLDAARRQAAVHGRELLERTMGSSPARAREIRAIEGLDVLDDRLAGRAGVHAYDPLRLAVDVRGVAASGYEIAPMLREIDDINLELYGAERARRRVRDGRAPPAGGGAGSSPLCAPRWTGWAWNRRARARASPRAPPWGELAMTPREAYLGAQEVVPAAQAVGRIAAESLATYPPGIPNVLPGERLTAETLTYIQRTLELGGSVRGASDRLLRTVRVVIEAASL